MACYEVECDAWAPRPRDAQARGAQAWGAHTCRALPRPTYTTPQHLRILEGILIWSTGSWELWNTLI